MTERILHIIPTLDRAGAEKQLVLLARGVPRGKFDTHVCVLTRDGPLRADLESAAIPTHLIGKRWKADPLTMARLVRHVRHLRPDLVHTWIFAGNAYGRAAALAAGVPRLVAGERCVDPWKGAWQLAIDRRLARRTDRIVANSRGVRDFYIARGLPAEKFTLIPNGVPPAEPVAGDRGALLAELGLPEGAWLAAAIGRLWPQKRVKELIWAFNLVHIVHPGAHLLIVGEGPQRRALERFARLVGSGDHVHFLGHRDDVPCLLPHLDVVLQGSGYEGQSNTVLESMAAGLPVVASDIEGNRDLVVHEETGLLVPLDERAAWVRAIDRLLRDAPLARRFGAAGQVRVAEQFGVQPMIDRHVALYEELLA